MKARYNPISKKLQKRINAHADAEFIKQRDGYVRRVLKLVCLSLHREAGYAAIRGGRIIADIVEVGKEHDNDEVFWYHADRYLKKIGYNFPDEDYDQMDG